MKFLFFATVSTILFFAFSPGHFTPRIFHGHDKIAHIFAFFVLSFGMKVSFTTYSIRRIFLIMALLAGGIEVIQYLFANREVSAADFGAGMVGFFIYASMLKMATRTYVAIGKISKSFYSG